jgi:ribosome assembly protein YihI (activator of Der GTPase)
LKSLLAPKKLTAMLSAHYTLEGNGLALPELLNRLSADIVLDKAPQSVLDRKLQKAYLHILVDLKGNEDTDAEVKGMVIAQLEVLKDRFKKFSKSSNPLVAAHGVFGLDMMR